MANRRHEPRAGKPARGLYRGLARAQRACLLALTLGLGMMGTPQGRLAKQSTVTGFDAVRVLVEYGQYENALALAKSFATDEKEKRWRPPSRRPSFWNNRAGCLKRQALFGPSCRRTPRPAMSGVSLPAFFTNKAKATHHCITSNCWPAVRTVPMSAQPMNASPPGPAQSAPGRSVAISPLRPAPTSPKRPTPISSMSAAFPYCRPKKSGIGYGYGLNGSYRFDLDETSSITAGGGVNGNWYRDTTFNTSYFDSFVDYRRDLGDWTVTGDLSANM
nr:hypothetical protein [Marinicella sp. W31]MDC2876494.1 hypothetical protein [Marinicella sp. W31]